jgi:thioredoxin-like negative regulator of GroEL
LAEARALARERPDDAAIRLLLGRLLTESGKAAEAAAEFEVVLGHDPEGADGGQRPALLAIQLVDAVTKCDQLALLAAR